MVNGIVSNKLMKHGALSLATCLCALVMLTLTGCTTPQGSFQSKKDPSYRRKMQRVLLVYGDVDTTLTLGRDFSGQVVGRVSELLEQNGVPSEKVRLEKAMLDRNAVVKAAATRFQPNQVLSFMIASINSSHSVQRTSLEALPQFSSSKSFVFSFSLMDADSGSTVWRAEARFHFVPRAEDVAAQLMDQLASDLFL